MRAWVGLLLLAGLVGCIDHPNPPVLPEAGGTSSADPRQATDTSQPAASAGSPSSPATTAVPSAAAMQVLAEVVYVFMKDKGGGDWICTGTAVSPHVVVTAAHCLDTKEFVSFAIEAPLAPNKPRISASSPKLLSRGYDDVAQPDIGVLRLDKPLVLPAYAQITDVSARVEGGEELTALAVVRTQEEAEAPLEVVDGLSVFSTTSAGYDHGYGTAYFSHGGDSGAGLFLVENGRTTHQLVGVARQPEPDAKRDHFTRIDPSFTAWFSANGAE